MRWPISMREKIGLIAVALLVLALVGVVKDWDQLTEGAVLRTGLAMGALWMAWPELCRLPRWLYLSSPVVLAAVAFRPQLLFFVIPAILFYWFLIPKPKRRGRGD